jgi:allantoicase
VLPFAPLTPDTYHRFSGLDSGPVTHVLYMHYPHGGIHGLKVFGTENI